MYTMIIIITIWKNVLISRTSTCRYPEYLSPRVCLLQYNNSKIAAGAYLPTCDIKDQLRQLTPCTRDYEYSTKWYIICRKLKMTKKLSFFALFESMIKVNRLFHSKFKLEHAPTLYSPRWLETCVRCVHIFILLNY